MKHFFFPLCVAQSNAQGTVPYLGIFLTDLTMLDTAVKDRLDVSDSHLYQGESRLQPPGSCSVFYNYQTELNTHILSLPFAERLHQLRQKEKGECRNVHQRERWKVKSSVCFLLFFLKKRLLLGEVLIPSGFNKKQRWTELASFFCAALTLQKKKSSKVPKKKNPVREKKLNKVGAIKRGERDVG